MIKLLLFAAAVHSTAGERLATYHTTEQAGHFIAKFDVDSGACESVRSSVANKRDSIMGFQQSARFPPVRTVMKRDGACILSFEGNTDLEIAVSQAPGFVSIKNDLLISVELAGSESDNQQDQSDPRSWGLNRIDQRDLPLSQGAPFTTSHTGKGVNIYVVDTGINMQHEDFNGRASYGFSYGDDGHGHGTHCAGVAAGKTFGIAKEANVIGVKVLGANGSGSTSGVIDGIDWASWHAKQTGRPGVISLSIGGSAQTDLEDAVYWANWDGNIVVIAAGNANAHACVSSPAGSGGKGKFGNPITVMATDPEDNRAWYSSYGKCTDIYAPGSNITSATKGSTTAFEKMSGTSMATPHVAGVAAILLEKHNFNKMAAIQELFDLAAPGLIHDAKESVGTPNLFLQVPKVAVAPSSSPTKDPNTYPPKPTPQPTKKSSGDGNDSSTDISGERESQPGQRDTASGAIIGGSVGAILLAAVCVAFLRKKYHAQQLANLQQLSAVAPPEAL